MGIGMKPIKIKTLEDLIEWSDEFDGDADFVAVREEIGGKVKVFLADDAGEGYVRGMADGSDSAELMTFTIAVTADADRRRE
jgi:hypothetical protein